MSLTKPGATQISCRTTLENRRQLRNKPRSLVFDAVIFQTRVVKRTQEVLCSLSFFAADKDDIPSDGIYDIVARVVEYQTGRNPISLSHDDNRFKLMGDISQLRRVPFKTQDISKQNIKLFKIPAWITVSGTVTSVDEDTLSFVVTTKQYVSTGDGNDTLRVRGRLEKGPRWKEPLKRLPTVDNIVHFEGTLQEVEEHDGNIQPVVLLDFIIYQTKPKKEDPGADEDNDLMLQRAKKYSQDNEGDGQSSPKALGKRKAPESDDEDAQSVKKELENSDNDNDST